jgi:hypothetical protein
MKPAASKTLPQTRATAYWVFPEASKKEAIRETVPSTMVERAIKGVEKNRDRRRLIASPQS